MTEKLTINLTDRDVDVTREEQTRIIKFDAQCPLCKLFINLTRINSYVCDCGIEWRAEVKIKGTRSVDDEDKFQMPLPIKAEYQSHDGMKEMPDGDNEA